MSLIVSFDSLDENKKKIEIDINDDSVLVETGEEVVPLNVELETRDGLEEVELCEEDIDFNVGFENVEYISDGSGGESYIYIPHVSQEGIISWTNDGGLPNPPPVNIRGPQGQAGEDGFSPIASVEQTNDGAIVTITDETSTTTAVIKNGVDGKDGSQGPIGETGPEGFSPVVTLTPTDTGLQIDVTNQDGTSSAYLEQGSKDHTILTNRDANDQHPISAITGLQSALDSKQPTGNYALASDVPTSTSQLTNDSGFITNVVSDLVNYYTKSQTYSAEEIDQRISAIPKFAIEVVDALPAQNISSTTVYLLRTGDTDNLYTEYIYVNGAWEVLGQQKVDLTGYATETWVEGKLADYIGINALQDAIDAALAQAKASGAFDGKDGTGIESITYKETDAQGGNVYDVNLSNGTSYDITAPRGEQGAQGIQGETGAVGPQGPAYVLTEADKQEIADEVKNVIKIPVVPTKVSAFENDAEYATTKAPEDIPLTETITAKFHTSNGGSVSFGKEGPNSGTMIRLDQEDGITRLLFRSSETKGAMVWEQPEQGAELYVDLGEKGNDYRRITFPTVAGRLVTAGALLDLVYPVGSIYMSVNSTDPSTFIGGTWERIQDRFLLSAGSAYAAGTTGGAATHTLTVEQMPAHNHKFAWADNSATADTNKITLASSAAASTSSQKWRTTNGDLILETGGGGAHNNMPPYLAVYIWKRTA